MKILAKFPMEGFWLTLVTSAGLIAQCGRSVPDKLQSPASVLYKLQIVGPPVAAAERI